jgi:hypothetical protein
MIPNHAFPPHAENGYGKDRLVISHALQALL